MSKKNRCAHASQKEHVDIKNSSFEKSLLALTVMSLLIIAPNAAYAEDEIERIEVTGSRIKRVDMEGASPVTVLTATDLSNAGFATVGDALRSSSLNAFGSWGGGSNNGWGSQSTVRLKGSSSEHTLTLLDGKRMAKSPVMGGGAANINTIPMAAVERIEILTDGASAIYGTDAIAGVVNIILKKDFEGVEFTTRMDRPTQEGGDSSNYSFTGGLNSDRGNLVFSFEHYEKDKIMNSDRWYTSPFVVEGGDPLDYQDWVNISPTGRVLRQGGAGGWVWEHPMAGTDDCAAVYGDNFVGVLNDSAYPGDTLCGYDYTRASANSVDQKRDNTLINYNYSINDDITLTARAYWSKNETMDISAPVPGGISIPQGLPAYTTNEGIELKELYADPWAGMSYRFDTAGQRVAEHHDTVFDFLVALDGSTQMFDWNMDVSYNKYTNFTWGTGYLLSGADTDLVGHWDDEANEFVGWDPRDPNSPLPPGAAANYDKRMKARALEINGGISAELFELSGGFAAMYLGASYREESLDSKVDALAEAGLIVGGNGGSGGFGERDVTAVFFEMALPVLDNMEVNIAARYDEYSDFGGTFNPQISMRYNPVESLMLRASFGTGFRAPTLSDLYQGTSEGFNDTTNYILCYENGEDIDSCEVTENSAVRTGGNTDLGPEESESINIGLVWDISDNIDLSVDYWSLETDGLIDSLHQDELMQTQAKLFQAADQAGTERPSISNVYPGAEISLLPNGRIDYVRTPTINIGKSDRKGLDIKLNTAFETEYGEFKASVGMSKYLEYRYTYIDNGVSIYSEDQSGREDTPDLRFNVTLDYTNGDHQLSYYNNYVGSQTSWDYADEAETKLYEIDSTIYHNLTYTYSLPWRNSITLGATNITNEDPEFKKNGTYQGNLYSIRGRTYYLSYSHSF